MGEDTVYVVDLISYQNCSILEIIGMVVVCKHTAALLDVTNHSLKLAYKAESSDVTQILNVSRS